VRTTGQRSAGLVIAKSVRIPKGINMIKKSLGSHRTQAAKRWKHSLSAAFMMLLVVACGNIQPGDSEFPKVNTDPHLVMDVTVIQPPYMQEPIYVWWTARNRDDLACSYFGGSGGGTPGFGVYMFHEPLQLSGSGGLKHGRLVIDKYEPGRCKYEYLSTVFRISRDVYDGNGVLLIDYSYGPKSAPARVRVDLWCNSDSSRANWSCSDRLFHTQPIRADEVGLTLDQINKAVESGAQDPPVLVGPDTHTLVIQLHDLSRPDHDLAIEGKGSS
jgi:hypothetical protein